MDNSYKQPSASVDLLTKVGIMLSMLSVLALLFSYLNHLMFYSFFGIPINNYIQAGEAIALFLPQLISYIIDTILIFSIWAFIAYVIGPIYKEEEPKKLEDIRRRKRRVKSKQSRYGTFHDHMEFLDMSRNIKLSSILLKRSVLNLKFKRSFFLFLRLLIVIVNFLSIPFILLIGPTIMLLPYSKLDNSTKTKDGIVVITFMFLFSLVSFDMIIDYANYLIFKIRSQKWLDVIRFLKIIFYAFLIIYIQASITASNIKSGHPEYDVSFVYDGKSVATDTSLVYIGATQNYTFLRNRHTRKNLVFKSDEIKNYTIKRVEYSNKWFWDK